MRVTSLSSQENWLTGVTYVVHEYAADYHSLEPIWSDRYVASANNKDTSQAYQTVPWMAKFTGCCREYAQQGAFDGQGSYNYEIKALVDLSDHVSSPRIISMPQIFLNPDVENFVQFCALPVAGLESMMVRNGGTINIDTDDNMPATFKWAVSIGGTGDTIEAIPVDSTVAGALPGDSRRSGMCARAKFAARAAPSLPSAEGTGGEIGIDSITISCTLGNAMVEADYELRVLPHPAAGSATQRVFEQSGTQGPWGCDQGGALCRKGTSLGLAYSLPSGIAYDAARGLELRYVVGTVGRPSSCGHHACQTPLLASAPGRVTYTSTYEGQDHQGLPMGAMLSPRKSGYVTDITVVFRASHENTRPGHEVTISAEQRQYADRLDGVILVDGQPWDPLSAGGVDQVVSEVPNTNFNEGMGGASVSLWLSKLNSDSPGPATPGTITNISIASPAEVQMLMDEGYTKLDKNLLEQSNRGELYIMYKRGSGKPLIDLSADRASMAYHAVSSSNGLVTLYALYGEEDEFDRKLLWTPCTGDDQPVVVCGAAAMSESGAPYLQSPQSCALFDPHPKRPPRIAHKGDCQGAANPGPDGAWVAPMGNLLKVCITAVDIDQGDNSLEVSFAEINGVPPDKAEAQPGLITGRTPFGAKITDINGVEGELTNLANSPCQDQLCDGYQGYLEWTPSPYQGGWSGEICIQACVSTGACPSAAGGPAHVCSQTCFKVTVPRCTWSLQNEDSFVEIAPRFQTNWLQLWYLNPGIGHPDFSLSILQRSINVGRVYLARWDDTMDGVAKRFGLTKERLIDFNADLAGMSDEEFSQMERHLCIIPNSCSLEAPSNAVKNE